MNRLVGVNVGERIAVGLVDGNSVVSAIHTFPPARVAGLGGDEFEGNAILSMPMDEIAGAIAKLVNDLCRDCACTPEAVGIGFPGIIKDAATIAESPNLRQAKGANLGESVSQALSTLGLTPVVKVYNSADATAAGLAATRGQLEKFIRVWTLGNGVGFGRYPHTGDVLEGGHIVVSLDPRETYCGCGGRGHLEGIMGHRAMRLRFLDLEPEEVFAQAIEGDQRCGDFVRLWHRALAAATASCIHMDGPGKFYICGVNARFIQPAILQQHLQEFVTMTPLQGTVLEVVPSSDEIAIVGVAVNAGQSTS